MLDRFGGNGWPIEQRLERAYWRANCVASAPSVIWISALLGLPVLTRLAGNPAVLAIWSAAARALARARIVVWGCGRGASATLAIVKPACFSRSAVRAARPATPAPFSTSTEIDAGETVRAARNWA